MTLISDVISNLYISVEHDMNETSQKIIVQKYRTNFYLKQGLGSIFEYLRDNTWNYNVELKTVKFMDAGTYINVNEIPHAKKG
jgi:hypothetical protein